MDKRKTNGTQNNILRILEKYNDIGLTLTEIQRLSCIKHRTVVLYHLKELIKKNKVFNIGFNYYKDGVIEQKIEEEIFKLNEENDKYRNIIAENNSKIFQLEEREDYIKWKKQRNLTKE